MIPVIEVVADFASEGLRYLVVTHIFLHQLQLQKEIYRSENDAAIKMSHLLIVESC